MAAMMCSLTTRFFLRRNLYFEGTRKRLFNNFRISDVLIKRLQNLRIEKPTAIQEKALGPVLDGKNTVINAETGSGKTLCYLLPIINKLLMDKEVLSRPPYALVLLPSIELCHQVAAVFQSLTDHSMQPCIVHRDSRLQIHPKYPIVLATPRTLYTYGLKSLANVQMVVTDEADLVISSGGDDIWEVLSFFKGVDSLKKRKKQQKRFRARQRALLETSGFKEQQNHSSVHKSNEIIETKIDLGNRKASIETEGSSSPRQFVFVAATLPSRGKKAVYNVLKEWVPDAEFVTTDLVHHTVPTVDIRYVKVEEALKLPELLRCLNSLVGSIRYPLSDVVKKGNKQTVVGNEGNVGDSASRTDQEMNAEMFVTKEEAQSLDSEKASFEDDTLESENKTFPEPVELKNLRVLVFVNTSKAAEQAFNFLSDNTQGEESDSSPWEHITQDDKIITMWHNDQDEFDEDDSIEPEYVVTHTGFKDIWPGRVGQIHGNIPPAERMKTLKQFISGELKVLISTDLASRGLDIPDVSHVIQLDFAFNAAQVLHRTGRTARAGASGKVINFVTENDEDLARAVRACEDSSNSEGYQATFSRNRMFRKRMKNNALPLADKL